MSATLQSTLDSLIRQISYNSIASMACVAGVLLGAVMCLWGYKIAKTLFALSGLFLGAMVGELIGLAVGSDDLTLFLILGAIAGAILLFFLYKVSVFCLAFTIGMLITGVLTDFSSDSMPICCIVGLVLGVLAVLWIRPSIIIQTSISGGSAAGIAFAALMGKSDIIMVMLCSFIFIIGGMIFQFKTTGPNKGSTPAAAPAQPIAPAQSVAPAQPAAPTMVDDTTEVC